MIEITGEQKVKKVHLDPDYLKPEHIDQLEIWIADAITKGISESQKVAAEKLKPYLSQLAQLGL